MRQEECETQQNSEYRWRKRERGREREGERGRERRNKIPERREKILISSLSDYTFDVATN